MITAGIHLDGGKDMLLLGLTRKNIQRLLAGQPIHIKRETHSHAVPENLEVALVFGENQQEIFDAFKSQGLINPDTEVVGQPSKEL